jgi:AcrR family transcriptional regulator
MNPPARPKSPSLRDRNKQRLRQRIVQSAMALVGTRGLAGVTADAIAADAEVGRATFFRYFDSKEAAVIVGFYEQRLTALVEVLDAAPAALGPMDAVIWTFRQLGQRPDRQLKLVRLHARMVTSSPLLRARAFEFHSRYEQAIANAVAGRFGRMRAGDPRPRLLAAAALAVVQASIEHWAEGKGSADLTALVLAGLHNLKAGFSPSADAVPASP